MADNRLMTNSAHQADSSHQKRRLSIAPMMDWTDRHCRYFHRLLAPSAWLYTEMVTTGALLHGDQARHLDFNDEEHPVALQLGGSDPQELADCARLGEQWGYDEINLNVGCPSDRVQRGAFGACLMKQPALVSDCLTAMSEAVAIPVTIKTRIGVDEYDSWAFFYDFVEQVISANIDAIIVHARKAWLSGLSPKQNREIPELQYHKVQRLKESFPELPVIVNGGITDVPQAQQHLTYADGVMLGRAAYQTPWQLALCQQALFTEQKVVDRRGILQKMVAYSEQQQLLGVPARHIGRHLLGLLHGQPGARVWRRWMNHCLQQNLPAQQWLDPLNAGITQAA